MNTKRSMLRILFIIFVSLQVYADEKKLPETAYVLDSTVSLSDQYAPVFLIEDNHEDFNKIGTPSARYTKRNREQIYVDCDVATVYESTHTFTTGTDEYTNLLYRVHFEKNPFTWAPFNVGAGKNVGAMVVITLDSQQEPVFISTVQSCGCYHAIVPTNYLSQEAYPDDWSPNGRMVYGEQLPGQLDFSTGDDSRLVVSIRSGTHRTMGLSVQSLAKVKVSHPVLVMQSAPMASLTSLPLGTTTTSFYHERGRKKGLVKGAFKPLETVAFGLWAWDSHVGQDREYGSKETVGRRFYTTLQSSKKKDADMWHYAHYLRHNGWKP